MNIYSFSEVVISKYLHERKSASLLIVYNSEHLLSVIVLVKVTSVQESFVAIQVR